MDDIAMASLRVGIVALLLAMALFMNNRSGRSILTSVRPSALAAAGALLIATALALRLLELGAT